MVEYEVVNDKEIIISFSNELSKHVYKPFFYKKLRDLKQAKTVDEFSEIFNKMEQKRSFQYATYLLSKRSYGSNELKAKLLSRFISEESSQLAIEKCLQCGYIDDEALVLSYIRRELRKGYGPKLLISKIAFKLRIEKEDVQNIYDMQVTEEELLEQRQKLVAKKKFSDPYKERQYLYKRGF